MTDKKDKLLKRRERDRLNINHKSECDALLTEITRLEHIEINDRMSFKIEAADIVMKQINKMKLKYNSLILSRGK